MPDETKSESVIGNTSAQIDSVVAWPGVWWERFAITKKRRDWTPGRIQAASRAVAREAECMALFPELRRIKTLDQRIESIDAREDKLTIRLRSHRAHAWIEVRRQLRALNSADRSRVLAKWNTRYMPGTPEHLAATIRLVLTSAPCPAA